MIHWHCDNIDHLQIPHWSTTPLSGAIQRSYTKQGGAKQGGAKQGGAKQGGVQQVSKFSPYPVVEIGHYWTMQNSEDAAQILEMS
jgi:hypothetical protein